MAISTPFFAAFGPLLFGRAPRAGIAALLKKVSSFSSIGDLFAAFGTLIPSTLLEPTEEGTNSRCRHYSVNTTFWSFLSQVLSPNSSCREAVRKIQAWLQLSGSTESISGETSAYCQARARMDDCVLERIAQHLALRLERNVPNQALWLGRIVKVADGTTISMPDTPANQADYPQSSSQKSGCGFPVMKLVGLFSLASGALLKAVTDNIRIHESRLFRRIWNHLNEGDVLLTDRGFSSYFTISAMQTRGVDSVMRLHQKRKSTFGKGKRANSNDSVQIWNKPAQIPIGCSQEDYDAMPDTLKVRYIRFDVSAKGFRSRHIVLVTTLLDANEFSLEAIGELYLQRWSVELHFREVKITLGMDILSCRTPKMIVKELLMHLIAYNAVRVLMQEASIRHEINLNCISFKGTLDTLRQWAGAIDSCHGHRKKQSSMINEMLKTIALDELPRRPDRSEPRAKKRRGKNYQLLTKPRNKMGNLPRRNRPQQNPKTSLS